MRDNALVNILFEYINFRLCELARRNFTLEQQVQLRECATSWLWNSEIGVYDTQETKTSPEESGVVTCSPRQLVFRNATKAMMSSSQCWPYVGLLTPVPSSRIDHVRGQDICNDCDDIVEVPPEYDGFDLKASGGHFGHKRVAHSTDGQLVKDCPYDH